MLYQFPTCGGLKFKILCAIWECQSFTKEKKGLGKIPHLSLVAKPLVTHGEFYFSPLVASPLRGEKSNPFFSSVKDWVSPPLLPLQFIAWYRTQNNLGKLLRIYFTTK